MRFRPLNPCLRSWWSPIFGLLLYTLATVAQSPSPQTSEPELQSRLRAAAQAQQAGDPEQVAQASRKIIAIGLRQMAELRLLEGLHPASVELLKQSADFEDIPFVHMQLAMSYAGAGDLDRALEQSSLLIRAEPNSADAWSLQGRLWSMKKDYHKAVDSFEKSLAIHGDMEVTYSLASALLSLNEKEKAAIVLKKIEVLTGKPEIMHIMAGRAYESAKLHADAEREYKAAIAINPKTSRGHYFLGLFYLTKNSWEPTPQAKQEFLAEVAINPKDFFGNYFLGYLASVEKKYPESDAYLKVAAAAKPDWPEPYLYMGLNTYGAGSDANAETYLRKAIELTGADESRNNYQVRRAYFTLGRILIRTGKRDEGTRLIQKSREMEAKLVVNARQQALSPREIASDSPALATPQTILVSNESMSPTNAAAPIDEQTFNKLALTPEQKSQAKAAEDRLRNILSSAYNDLGTSEARRKDYATALSHFLDAERWSPATPGLMRNIGLAAFRAENYTESARALKSVLAADPSDQRSQAMLAMSLFSIKDYPAAAAAFAKIPDLAMSDPRMSYDWAASLARTNDRQRAASILASLLMQPAPSDLLVRACQLYQEMQDPTGAQSCFQKAKEQHPDIQLPN